MPIAQSLDKAKFQVEKLVERFAQNLDVYKRPDYRETQVRIEYIDPFFEALDGMMARPATRLIMMDGGGGRKFSLLIILK